MERKIIGYTLKSEKYAEEACKIEGYLNFGEAIMDCAFINLKGREEGFRRLATSGKLDELFNTVYEGDSYKVGIFSSPPLSYKEELPEKWAVRGCQLLIDNISKVFADGYFWHGNDEDMYYFLDSKGKWDALNYLPEKYTIITEEQFKQIIEKELNKKEMKTYKVTREQLAEVYSIACSTWKPKIEKITNDALGAFGTDGKLSEEIVQSMRDAATTDQRPVIDRIFPKPKKKVTRQINLHSVLDTSNGDIIRTYRSFSNAKIDTNINKNYVVVTTSGTYEVEEEC